MLIGGVSVVLAGQALGPGTSPGDSSSPGVPASRPPAATSTPTSRPAGLPAAPELLPADATLTTEPTITISGRLTEELPRASHRLRVYINGELERDRRLPRRRQFTLEVPLVEGHNSITLAVSGPAGESLHSSPLEITLDSTAPTIGALEPSTGQTIYADQATIRGTSEPGARLRLTSQPDGTSKELIVGDDGRFEVAVDLLVGFNQIVIETRDAAGNSARAGLTLERREGAPSAELDLSRTTIGLAELPRTVSLRAVVRDAAGQSIDGAEVFFSLSPPGMPTLTYDATTVDGVARWASVRISQQAVAGEGLATVLVTLPDGQTLTDSVYFTIED